MSKERRNVLIRYGITTFVGALAVCVRVFSDEFAQSDQVNRYRILCDAFTVPGLLFILFGGLVWASNEGAFDGIRYALTRAIKMLVPFMGGKRESYGDYLERRQEKGKTKGYSFLFVVGAVFMAVALIFLALFYSVFE